MGVRARFRSRVFERCAVAIELHEEVALGSTVALAALGLLAGAGLALSLVRRTEVPRVLSSVVFVAGVGVAVAMGITANLGGQIRHPEIRDGGSYQAPDTGGTDEEEEEPVRERERRGG